MPNLPFVDHGGMQSWPPPIAFTYVTFWGFLLEGSQSRIQKLVDHYLTEPTGGEMEFVALSKHVLLAIVDMPKGHFTAYPDMGYASEREFAFWLPVARVKREGPIKVVEQLGWFLPYMFVDNPVALVTGREAFGFWKALGWMTMPTRSEPGTPFTLDAMGAVEFSPETRIDRQRLLEVHAADAAAAPKVRAEWGSFKDAAHAVRHAMGAGGDLLLPGLHVAKQLVDDLVHRDMPLIFLKQFRSIEAGDQACYQAIVGANAHVDHFQGIEFESEYDFSLRRLESHPITEDLGVDSQRASLSFRVEMGMTFEGGTVFWEKKPA